MCGERVQNEREQQLIRERDQARVLAEYGLRYMVEEQGEDPEETCPPWMSLDLWLTQLGRLADTDHDEMCIELDAGIDA
mgnify:CR=1 FL=1